MAKVTPLSDLASLANETSAITTINTNNQRVEDAFANTLSRDGSAPNAMNAVLDMGTHRVINLAAPVSDNDAVRLTDLDSISQITFANLQEAIDAVDTLGDIQTATEGFKDDAEAAAVDAAASAVEAASYVGAATSAPSWTTPRTLSFTGNVTGSGVVDGTVNVATALTIANDAVTNAMLANVATATFKGRTTAGTGDSEDLTVTQATALLHVFGADSGAGGVKGLAPATVAGDATKYLKGNGTWSAVTVADPDLIDLDSSEKSLISANGSVNMGPVIIKWGTHSTGASAAGYTTITFVDAFPNGILGCALTPRSSTSNPGSQDSIPKLVSKNTTSLYVYEKGSNGGVVQEIDWLAIGY